MNTEQSKARLKLLNDYNNTQPNQHISLKQEKFEYAKMMERRVEIQKLSKEKYGDAPKRTFINHLRAFVINKDITSTMIEKEEEWAIN